MGDEEGVQLRERIRADPQQFGEFVAGCRARLLRMVEIRMDPRLRGRLDASDVVQDACAEAVTRLPDWLDGQKMPLHLWLRFLTAQKLMQVHRQHLGVELRDAGREVPLDGAAPDASAATLASAIAESGVLTPSGVAMQAEVAQRLHAALESMKAEDREVLVLRHFEQLSNGEVAQLLGLSKPGASLRFLRAAKRLREILGEVSGIGAK